ncbi:hypothetical protein C0993_004484 [Termitomyces sp. T159_Od127]|nr:hypothetical protein C0993_004484 [Termitomyces sp. T159_Od127]
MLSTSTIANSPPSSVHGEKTASIEEEDKRHNPSPPPSEIRRIQRKIDIRIIPWLCFTYLVMKTDANNITNSAIMNAEKKHDIKSQLKLSPAQWNWVIACFFYPYAFLEPASTLMIKKTTPSFWLGRLMVTWGIICACVGAVQKYGDLIAVRVLQGAAEAGYYPGIIYYLAFWFRPDQMARRVAAFYSFGQLSGFLGGLLAFAISHADGHLAGWRWLFIIGEPQRQASTD